MDSTFSWSSFPSNSLAVVDFGVDLTAITQEHCKKLVTPSTTQFAISCALIGWLLLSYIPQFARIISRRSAEGLSTLYILLGSMSGTCAVACIMVLPQSQNDIACCRHYTRFGCISRLVGIFQVVSGVSLFWCIMFLYVYYSEDEADAELHGRRRSISSPDRTFRRARRAIRLLITIVAFAFTILVVSAVVLNRFPWYSQQWANILGMAVATFACVQWVPQVWTTIHLGQLGSLSLTSICMGAPYTWIFGITMIIRLGLAGWSVWIVYVLVGTMQLTLITTAFIYMFRDYRKKVKAEKTRPPLDSSWNSFCNEQRDAQDEGRPTERSPLLAGGRRNSQAQTPMSPRKERSGPMSPRKERSGPMSPRRERSGPMSPGREHNGPLTPRRERQDQMRSLADEMSSR